MRPCKKVSSFLAIGFTLLFSSAAGGQDWWEKKPYQKWSEEEARKLLNKSPWAQEKIFSQTIIQPLQSPGLPGPISQAGSIEAARSPDPSARADVGRAREARPELKYVVQFRSALPVRQAIVRLGQISIKYDTLTSEQKQTFDRDTDAFLTKSFADTVIVYVSYSSNVPIDERELAFHWQSQTTDTLKNFVFLIRPNGAKIPILGYVVAKGAGREFQFVFPRSIDGQAILRTGDKTLQLEFVHPKIRDQKEQRVLMSFNTEKMLVNGVPVF